jgi:hypothetical protein
MGLCAYFLKFGTVIFYLNCEFINIVWNHQIPFSHLEQFVQCVGKLNFRNGETSLLADQVKEIQ